ncbi:hypothetical protein QFC22_004506 [Naganishia vaughanmartiniae]|uniref:Uncharacterized protein n=1 Tax=Naganishia vaughanmartiniae TaxID=1424756 RepID=A0ACC2X0E9_9TREE|nr:hypothetical protein QFC22_004506 [Naganishia vaughanmartiniae]
MSHNGDSAASFADFVDVFEKMSTTFDQIEPSLRDFLAAHHSTQIQSDLSSTPAGRSQGGASSSRSQSIDNVIENARTVAQSLGQAGDVDGQARLDEAIRRQERMGELTQRIRTATTASSAAIGSGTDASAEMAEVRILMAEWRRLNEEVQRDARGAE